MAILTVYDNDGNPIPIPAIKGEPGTAGAPGPQGPAGQDGANGQDGEDGYSPAVTISQITGGHTVKITDKTHPSGQTFDVLDGSDAEVTEENIIAALGYTPADEDDLSGKLDKSGGTMTGDITMSSGNALNFTSNMAINLSTASMLSAYGTPNTSGAIEKIGSHLFNLTIRGRQTRPDYTDVQNNTSSMALLSDVEGIIDDTAGDGDVDKTWSADKLVEELGEKADAADVLPKPASGLAVGKYFRVATYDSETGAVTLEAVNDPATIKGIAQEGGVQYTPDENGIVNIPKMGTGTKFGLTIPGPGLQSDHGTMTIASIAPSSYSTTIGNRYIDQQFKDRTPILLNNVDAVLRIVLSDGRGPAWSGAEKTGTWKRMNTIKTAMDSVAATNAKYFLGEQSAVALVLPSPSTPAADGDPEAGMEISCVFYSGATATTLTVTGDILGTVPTPAANQRVEINALFDGLYWSIVSKTDAVPVEETV